MLSIALTLFVQSAGGIIVMIIDASEALYWGMVSLLANWCASYTGFSYYSVFTSFYEMLLGIGGINNYKSN